MRHYAPACAALVVLLATSVQASDRKSLLTTRPPEQKNLEQEVLNIKPRPTTKARTTIVERVSGQRIVITTDENGTRATEQGSGRMIWSANRDSHDLKVGEYTSGGMGKVVTSGQARPAE